MCFSKEKRLITARWYKAMSCHRLFSFRTSKKYDETLVLELVNDKGVISFTFNEANSKEVKVFDEAKSNTYEFPVEKGKKYCLRITAKATSGSYKIYLKRRMD